MPNAVVKSYAKKTGKSISKIEGYWEEAEEQAEKKFKKGSPRYWAYVNGIVKKRVGLDEGQAVDALSFKEFLTNMHLLENGGDGDGPTNDTDR